MFIDKLDIKEFRGIKSCVKPIVFSNFSVLIGRNNSGKSTILEALSLLPNSRGENYISGSSLANLYSLHPSDSMFVHKRLLYLYAGTARLDYSCSNKTVKIEITEDSFKALFNKKELSPVYIAEFFGVEPNQLSKLVAFIPYNTSIYDVLEKKMKDCKELITKKGVHIELAKFLNQCVNDEYSEIVFLEPLSLRKIFQNNNVYIQLKDLGSGAEKVIKIMAILEVMTPKLVLIDDFEAGLHPSLIKLFLNWLKEKNWQTIISTHSIDVLYQLADIKPKDLTILQLNKSREDVVNYGILTLEELEDILNANADPRLLVDALRL